MLDRLLVRVRSFPSNLLLTGMVYFGVTFVLTSGTPTEPPISDFIHYVNMANGLAAPDPFGKRVLAPFLAGLLGGTPIAFHYMNLVLVTVAAYLLFLSSGRGQKGFISGLLFLACTRAIALSAGEPAPDPMMYLLIAGTIYFTQTEHDWLVVVIAPLAAATHPIAFVIVAIIWLVHAVPNIPRVLLLIPGGIIFVLLLPHSYGLIFLPDLGRVVWMAKSINVLWLALLGVRRDRTGALILLAVACCIGFSLLASNVDRIFAPLGLLTAPLLTNIIFPREEASQ